MDLKLEVLRQEVKRFRKKSQRATERLLALTELTKFRQNVRRVGDDGYDQIGNRFEISGRTLRRWEAAYLGHGAEGLIPGKATGRKGVAIRGVTAARIVEMRRLYNWGAEVIQAHLKFDYNTHVTQNKINRFLHKKGLIKKRRKKLKNKHTKQVVVTVPGTHTQTDVKHLPKILENGQKCYVYNFVDHASKWSFKKAYDSYGPSETRDFMNCVLGKAPFVITRLQSDNGAEFTNKYLGHWGETRTHVLDELCAANEIRHVLIPPGEKELQGLVERSHRQDDEELYHRIRPVDLAEFNRTLTEHCEWRNSKRRRKALEWKTSDEFLSNFKKLVDLWIYKNGPSPFAIQEKKNGAEECVNSDRIAA